MLKDLPPLPPLGQLDDLNFPADPAPQAPSVYAGSMKSRSHIMSQYELSPSSSSASLRDAAARKPSSSSTVSNDSTETTYMKRPAMNALGEYDPVPPLRLTGKHEFTAVPTKPVQPSTLRRESDLSFMTNASTDSISWQPHSIKPLLPLKQPPQRLAQPQVVPVQTQLTPLKHSRSMAYAKPKDASLQSSASHYVPALMPLASSKESDAIYCQSQITLVSQSSKTSKHSVVPPLLPLATSKEKSEEEQRQKQSQKKVLPLLSPLKSTAAKFEPFNQIQQPISVSSGRSTCVESVLTEQCEPLVSRMRAAGLEITRLLKASTEAFHDVSSMISETLAEEIFFSFNNHLNELLASLILNESSGDEGDPDHDSTAADAFIPLPSKDYNRAEWSQATSNAQFGSMKPRKSQSPPEEPPQRESLQLQPAEPEDMYQRPTIYSQAQQGTPALNALNELLFMANEWVDYQQQKLVDTYVDGRNVARFVYDFDEMVEVAFAEFAIAVESVLAVVGEMETRPSISSDCSGLTMVDSNPSGSYPQQRIASIDSALSGIIGCYADRTSHVKGLLTDFAQSFGADTIDPEDFEQALSALGIDTVKYSKEQLELYAKTSICKTVTNQMLLSTGVENEYIDRLEEAEEGLAVLEDCVETLRLSEGDVEAREQDLWLMRRKTESQRIKVEGLGEQASEARRQRRIFEALFTQISSI
ncbi:hypothetical protein DL89DRAFT_290021 [Linderina pennispora]|uniref:Uncharacterized protein n=1 Tax=Linderina pennispora TaxID=61395 RepID=A0A1Y1WLU3_9FUNG|nr:uncharacterized protein DL89DRAFT_290021 [Linderina pennispora]ORX74462.1 hypothetical protein DL89DRAFT_290021 [Linderina pennispora]